jgi:hypothetical protein
MTTTETVVWRAIERRTEFLPVSRIAEMTGVRVTDLTARVLPSLTESGRIVRAGEFYRKA